MPGGHHQHQDFLRFKIKFFPHLHPQLGFYQCHHCLAMYLLHILVSGPFLGLHILTHGDNHVTTDTTIWVENSLSPWKCPCPTLYSASPRTWGSLTCLYNIFLECCVKQNHNPGHSLLSLSASLRTMHWEHTCCSISSFDGSVQSSVVFYWIENPWNLPFCPYLNIHYNSVNCDTFGMTNL